ncbi:MAG: glycine cleavage T C-terminal barrel domain-containing protein, partial [Gammaproteobacteria bacterium]
FVLEDPAPLLHHNEPVYRDGELNSYTTSAMYGHTLGGAVAMAYVVNPAGVDEAFITEGRFEIEQNGRRYPARASLRPAYDPDNRRVRA